MSRVYTIGVFDVFHRGHLNLLKQARDLGELYVGVVCDEAVKRVKGETRPLIKEEDRLNIVQNISGVYFAGLIEDFEFSQIAIDNFDIIILGEDQKHVKGIENIPIEKIHKINRTPNVSTSDIIKKIKDS